MRFWVLGGLWRLRLGPLAVWIRLRRRLSLLPPAVPAVPAPIGWGAWWVLAHHEIADPDRAAIPDYAVRPADFAAQLEWLVGHGYRSVCMPRRWWPPPQDRACP